MNKNNSNSQINNDELISMDDLLKDDMGTAVELNKNNEEATDAEVKVEEPKATEKNNKSNNLGLKYGAAAAVGVGVAAAGAYAIDGMNAPAAEAEAEAAGVATDEVVNDNMNAAATAEEIENIITGGAAEDEVLDGEESILDEEIAIEETPVEEVIVEETPAEEVIVEETPAEEVIVEETPAEEVIVEETPVEEVAVEETPAEEVAAEVDPAEEVAVEATPAEEVAVEEIPVVEAMPMADFDTSHIAVEADPAEEVIVEETPVEEVIVEDIPNANFDTSDIAVEADPAEEVAAEAAPAEEVAAEAAPAEEVLDAGLVGEESILDEEVVDIAPIHEEPISEPATLQFDINDVTLSHAANDHMDFSQAFAAARADVGANGVFEWRGGVYGTFYQDEWDNVSDEYKEAFNNHDWTNEFNLADNSINRIDIDVEPIHLAGNDGGINVIDDDLHAALPNRIYEDGTPNVIDDASQLPNDSFDMSGIGHLADNGGHAIDGFALNAVPEESYVPELVADSADDFSGAYVLTEDPSANMIAMADDIIDVLPVDIAENVDIDVQVMNVVPADDMSAFEPMDNIIDDNMGIDNIDDMLI